MLPQAIRRTNSQRIISNHRYAITRYTQYVPMIVTSYCSIKGEVEVKERATKAFRCTAKGARRRDSRAANILSRKCKIMMYERCRKMEIVLFIVASTLLYYYYHGCFLLLVDGSKEDVGRSTVGRKYRTFLQEARREEGAEGLRH